MSALSFILALNGVLVFWMIPTAIGMARADRRALRHLDNKRRDRAARAAPWSWRGIDKI